MARCRWPLGLWLAAAVSLLAQGDMRDLAVTRILLRADRSLGAAAVWRRTAVSDDLELVLAIGAPSRPSIGSRFVPLTDRLLMATDAGIIVIHDDTLTRYIIDETTDHRLRVVEGLK